MTRHALLATTARFAPTKGFQLPPPVVPKGKTRMQWTDAHGHVHSKIVSTGLVDLPADYVGGITFVSVPK